MNQPNFHPWIPVRLQNCPGLFPFFCPRILGGPPFFPACPPSPPAWNYSLRTQPNHKNTNVPPFLAPEKEKKYRISGAHRLPEESKEPSGPNQSNAPNPGTRLSPPPPYGACFGPPKKTPEGGTYPFYLFPAKINRRGAPSPKTGRKGPPLTSVVVFTTTRLDQAPAEDRVGKQGPARPKAWVRKARGMGRGLAEFHLQNFPRPFGPTPGPARKPARSPRKLNLKPKKRFCAAKHGFSSPRHRRPNQVGKKLWTPEGKFSRPWTQWAGPTHLPSRSPINFICRKIQIPLEKKNHRGKPPPTYSAPVFCSPPTRIKPKPYGPRTLP